MRIKWVVETTVVEAKQHAPILRHMGVNLGDTWDAVGDALKDGFEPNRVFALHELDDVAKIVAMDIQMALRPGAWQAPRSIGLEI